MQLGKRLPVLLTGIMLAVAALAMACSSNNNNKNNAPAANNAPVANAGSPAPAAPGGIASPSAASATRAAASATSAAAAPPSDLAPDAQQQVTLNLGAEVQYLDPQKSNFQQDITIEHLLWRGLFYFDKDTNTVPALATQIPTKDNGGISSDGLTYTIKMKTGQKFSDGSPLTATDMEYSIKRMLDPNVAGEYASFFYDIVGAQDYNTALGTKDQPKNPSAQQLQQMQDALGVKALDPQTIQFKLTAPSGSFVTRLALWAAYPMEKAAIDKMGSNPMDVGNLIGNGPFILKEHVPKDHITLAANPNYTLGPQPYLKQIVWRDIEDPVQALNAYNNGELDAIAIPPQQFQQINGNATLKAQLHAEAQPNSLGLEFNEGQKPFDNAMVRMAFAKAIDRNQFAQVVYQGTAQPGATWLPPGLPGYTQANESIQSFDVNAAKQLLSQAGYPNGQGMPDIKMMYTDNSTNQLIFQFLQQQLKQNLGVNLVADAVDAKTRSSRINSKDFQLIYGGWIQDYPNADDWLPIWQTNDTNNKYNYASQQFDAAVNKAKADTTTEQANADWGAADKILLSDAAVAPLVHRQLVSLWKPKVKGLTGSLQDSTLYGDEFLETAYVSKS